MKKYIIATILIIISFQTFSQNIKPVIELYGSPVYHFFEKSDNAKINQSNNFSFGILISNNFGLKKNTLSIRFGYFIDRKNYSKTFSDTISWYPHTVNTDFVYGNIPIQLDYIFSCKHKLKPFVSVGFILGHIIKESQKWEFNNGNTQNGFMKMIYNNKYPKYINFSFGFIYQLNENIGIRCEPYLKWNLIDNSPYNYDKEVNKTIGFKLGICYNVKNNEHDYGANIR